MNLRVKLLFSAIAVPFIAIGVLAILTETHTGYVRFIGVRTVFGAEAVWVGKTCLLLAALPLLVWVPKHRIGPAVTVWWLALMAWLFGPFFMR